MPGSHEDDPTQELSGKERARLLEQALGGGSAEPPSLEGPPPLADALDDSPWAEPPPRIEEAPEPKAQSMAPVIGLLVSFLIVFAVVVGAAVVWVARSDESATARVQQAEASRAGLAEAMEANVAELEKANAEVARLRREVHDQTREVAALERRLEAEVTKGGARSAAVQAEREALEQELASVQAALAESRRALASETDALEAAMERARSAELETDALIAELTTAQSSLADARAALSGEVAAKRLAKERLEATQWSQLLLAAQLSVCAQGTRGQLEACRAKVEEVLVTPARRARFVECIRKKESRASVHWLPSGTPLPRFAEILDPADPELADWYIAYCDPSLPDVPGRDGEVAIERVEEPRAEPPAEPTAPPAPSPEAEAPEPLSPEPEPQITRLDAIGIETTPPGATVEVDGQPRGRTPVKLGLASGSHRISLRLGDARVRFAVPADAGRNYCFEVEGRDLVEVDCRAVSQP